MHALLVGVWACGIGKLAEGLAAAGGHWVAGGRSANAVMTEESLVAGVGGPTGVVDLTVLGGPIERTNKPCGDRYAQLVPRAVLLQRITGREAEI